MHPTPESPPQRACIRCGQSLDGVHGRKCPGCGLLFDPLNRRTFRTPQVDEPPEWWEWSPRMRTALGASALLLTVLTYESLLWLRTSLLNYNGPCSLLWIAVWFGSPLWIFLMVLWALALLRWQQVNGLLTWVVLGAVAGSIISLAQAMGVMLIVGCCAGTAAGLVRHFWEI